MLPRHALSALLLVLASAATPDTSLRTIPVAYYGANWNRSHANLEMLSKQRIVVLMQEDGDCWLKCCPHVMQRGMGKCQPDLSNSSEPYNASLNPGCNPSCDQHGKQTAIFQKVKDMALAQKRDTPHCMLYMNGVYDWPFDAAHAAGAEQVDVLDVNGKPHIEVCDPGIYPSFFLDYGRVAGRKAFSNAIEKYVANGAADGVFLDNFGQIPMRCNSKTGECTASRNSRDINKPSTVTAKQVEAYIAGKNESLTDAASIIRKSTNGAFAAFTCGTAPNPNGANMAWVNVPPSIEANATVLSRYVEEAFQNGYEYLAIDYRPFARSPTGNRHDLDKVKSQCSDYEIAMFLLAWKEGCFLACNGWSDDFDRPVGAPQGEAVLKDGVMTRSFSAGVRVDWIIGTANATIQWASKQFIV